ncbi:PAS domain S-box protein [Mariprofundus erugo]|uniref:histidine kinase n=1 Tax=Mariprofundus erugo TaxID=2528639 RepID=A0A5R9GUE2_9PROT|nr:PAS domain S-box protein [Mariprofundus erugo]TLS69138.1 PAS domain S-box protein [Mariprofundus erugo]
MHFISPSSSEHAVVMDLPVVAIGASAGGLEALKSLFDHTPADTGAAFIVISHMDPTHTSMLAEILARHTAMPISDITDGTLVMANRIFVIPPGYDLSISHSVLRLHEAKRKGGLRLPVDSFCQSLAHERNENAIGIILSGTGSDGTAGMKAIKSFGGLVIVQKPDDAQYDGMPANVMASGAADYILPAAEIGSALQRYLQHCRARGFLGTRISHLDNQNDDYYAILSAIRRQLGYDFFSYRKSTLLRRIKRRLAVLHLDSIADYAAYILSHHKETEELFMDMLIGVTSFFRDPDVWGELQKEFIARLGEDGRQSLRIWMPGCATGEEVYSLAIMLQEHIARKGIHLDYQIFATDIDSRALASARSGIYPENIADTLSAERLQRFFSHEGNHYRVLPSLRAGIVFSEQNLLSDPPFSKLDAIICRNLFIYLQSEAQARVLEIFHFSLNPHGYLLLGNTESIGHQTHLFETISKKWRLFRRINSGKQRNPGLLARQFKSSASMQEAADLQRRPPVPRVSEIATQVLLKEYVPASVLINSKYQVLYHYGDTAGYLHYPTGESTHDLFALLREGLGARVRTAIHKALKEKKGVRVEGARIQRDDQLMHVNLRAKPLADFEGGEGLILISFENASHQGSICPLDTDDLQPDSQPLIKQLEQELLSTREDLQNTIEELESSNEELKTANEEAMSSNEELQSSNEELETSKEELQSYNEELNTVNSELQEKIIALEQANTDLNNLMTSSDNASVFLDAALQIRFFTPASRRLFNLIASDIGRPLSDIAAKFDHPQLLQDIDAVLQNRQGVNREVRDHRGDWYNCRILPYRSLGNEMTGAVITFDDITAVKMAMEEIREHREQLHLFIQYAPAAIAMFDCNMRYIAASRRWRTDFNLGERELAGLSHYDVFPDLPERWKEIHRRCLAGAVESCDEDPFPRADGSIDWVRWQELPWRNSHGEISGVIIFSELITERKQAEQLLRDSQQLFRETFEQAAVGIAHVGIDGEWLRINRRLAAMLGYTHDELLGKTFQQITHPDDLDADLKLMQQLIDGVIPHYTLEKRYLLKDGAPLWINLTVALVRNEQGEPDYFIAVIEDINERKLAQERLQVSEKTLRQAQETAHIGSWSCDGGGRITWSDELYHIFGLDPAVFTPDCGSLASLAHPDDRLLMQKWVEQCLASQAPLPEVFRIIRPDGVEIYVRCQSEVVSDGEGRILSVNGTVQDISEHKQLEEQFIQAQKMEALGTLVGGIAHDFNNILAGMTGNLYLAGLDETAHPETLEHIRNVDHLSMRASELIRQLLTFARKDRVNMKPLPLPSFIKEMIRFLQSALSENIALKVDVPDHPLVIRGDATQLHQVVMNLVNNARDALAGRENPKISVALVPVHGDESFRRLHPEAEAGDYVDVRVQDNGCGIPADLIEHIFDPFFTTKEQGKGTGLGLAMVFGAVKTHHGFIEVESSDAGTCFHIYLPLVDAEPVPVDVVATQVVSGHGELILLVDDDPQVITVGARVLKRLGYRVLEAHSGEQAVALFSASQDEVALVVMDLVMPHMSGVQAVEKIRMIKPEAKVIFCTGYDKELALPQDALANADVTIVKPYNIDDFSRVIRQVLVG